MSKIRKKFVFVIILIVLSFSSIFVFSLLPGSPVNQITGPFSIIFDPIKKISDNISTRVSNFFEDLNESERIREENENLKREKLELELKVKELEEYERRWEELKSAFKIRDSFADFEIKGAGILTRSSGYWFDIFKINVGIRDGVIVDDMINSYTVVDAKMNLVGRVVSSDYVSAKVLPLLNEGSVVSGKIDIPGGPVIRIKGELLLKDEGICLIDNIPDGYVLAVGDKIVTSGLGGLYPPGLPIGEVCSFSKEGLVNGNFAFVKINADYRTLKDVFLMMGKKQ